MTSSKEVRRTAGKTSLRKFTILFLVFSVAISVLQFFVWPGNAVLSTLTGLLVPTVLFLLIFKSSTSIRQNKATDPQ
ncbi:hypothetical protein MB46_03055 [Arthrobacter alpinus]|nr:hypothetical protein MB46_03055 [Arthrobacter alpinus]